MAIWDFPAFEKKGDPRGDNPHPPNCRTTAWFKATLKVQPTSPQPLGTTLQ